MERAMGIELHPKFLSLTGTEQGVTHRSVSQLPNVAKSNLPPYGNDDPSTHLSGYPGGFNGSTQH